MCRIASRQDKQDEERKKIIDLSVFLKKTDKSIIFPHRGEIVREKFSCLGALRIIAGRASLFLFILPLLAAFLPARTGPFLVIFFSSSFHPANPAAKRSCTSCK
jgi:hypothetical protein